MSSKKHKKKTLAAKRAQQIQYRPSQRVDEAYAALKQGDVGSAIDLTTKSLNAGLDPSLRSRAQSLLVEAHFRAAANATSLEQRLVHLNSAVRTDARQARVHFHLGMTLWKLNRAAEAAQAFDAALVLEPHRPGLKFLCQLARVANGQPASEDGLAADEINSLRLAQILSSHGAGEDLAAQSAGQSFVGQADRLWETLLQMAAQPKSTPAARYASELAAASRFHSSSIAAYYAGVVAMRKGDKTTALSHWRKLASEGALAMPWFKENSALLVREEAVRLAEAGQWQAVTQLEINAGDVAGDGILAELLAAAHFRLGETAAEAGQWKQAARHWERANHLVGDRRSAQNLALALERLERWNDAAASWREMVRRRPRKSDHPDYLTDDQVSALWQHAAECYAEAGNSTEVIACLKNALKYKAADPDLRLRLVDAYMADDRVEAARNELERLLEITPDHVTALTRLGMLYQSFEFGDPMPLWRRVVNLDPANREAKDALAVCYVELASSMPRSGWLGGLLKRTEKQQIKILQDGLHELPGHPILLLELGRVHRTVGKNQEAQTYLRQAWEAATTEPNLVAQAIHELLHAKAEAVVEELLPSARNIPGLLASFWLDQADKARICKLGERWINLFFEEALKLSDLRRDDDTAAYTLIRICDIVEKEDTPETLAKSWEARARAEAANAGLGEYIDANHAGRSGNRGKALELLRKGRRLANKAGEPAVARHIQRREDTLGRPKSFLDILMNQLGPGDIEELLEQMEREGRNEFKRFR